VTSLNEKRSTRPQAVDLAALHDVLDAAALAAFVAEDGDTVRAELALLEASMAGALAFPVGSAESRALSVVLSAISRAASGSRDAGEVAPAAAAPGDWAMRAACKDADPALFFCQGSEDEATAVCGTCPVQAECLAHSLEAPELFGTWGGVGEVDRRRLLARASGETRQCGQCMRGLPLDEFASDGHGGRLTTCLECRNQAQRERRASARNTGQAARDAERS
jgi:WhiB family redox-sensing transcriptional regulator